MGNELIAFHFHLPSVSMFGFLLNGCCPDAICQPAPINTYRPRNKAGPLLDLTLNFQTSNTIIPKDFRLLILLSSNSLLSLLLSHLSESFHTTGTNRSRRWIKSFTSIESTLWRHGITCIGGLKSGSVALDRLRKDTFSLNVTRREADALGRNLGGLGAGWTECELCSTVA